MTSTTTIFDTAPTVQSAAWAFAGPALGCVFGAIITYHFTEYDPVRDLAARATALWRAWRKLPLTAHTDAADTGLPPLALVREPSFTSLEHVAAGVGLLTQNPDARRNIDPRARTPDALRDAPTTRTDTSDTQRTPLLAQHTRNGVMHPATVFEHPNNLNDFNIRRNSARIGA